MASFMFMSALIVPVVTSLVGFLRFRLYMAECRRLITRGEADQLPALGIAARAYLQPARERVNCTHHTDGQPSPVVRR
jgi:hypothetical protein